MANNIYSGPVFGTMAGGEGDLKDDQKQLQLTPELFDAYMKATKQALVETPEETDSDDPSQPQVLPPFGGPHGIFSSLRGESAPTDHSYSADFLNQILNSSSPEQTSDDQDATETPDAEPASQIPAVPAARDLSSSSDSSPDTSSPAQLSDKNGLNVLNFGKGSINNVANLQAAQDQANQNRKQAMFFAGLDQLSAGLNYAQPTSQQFYEQKLKEANQPVEEYLQRAQMEKNDPNSPMSQGFRDYLKQFGLDVRGDFSAADGEKLMPSVLKSYEADQTRQANKENLTQKLAEQKQNLILKLKEQEILKQMVNAQKQRDLDSKQSLADAKDQKKALGDVSGKVLTYFGRAGRTAYNNELFANNALSLVEGTDPQTGQQIDANKLSPRKVNLFMSEIQKMAKGGVGTEKELETLLPPKLMRTVKSIQENVSNSPVGADAGAFVNDMIPYLHDLKSNAQKQLGGELEGILSSNRSRLAPQDFNNLINVHKTRLAAAGSPLLSELGDQGSLPSVGGNPAQVPNQLPQPQLQVNSDAVQAEMKKRGLLK